MPTVGNEAAFAATICRMFQDGDRTPARARALAEYHGFTPDDREVALIATVCQMLEENSDNLHRAETLFQSWLDFRG